MAARGREGKKEKSAQRREKDGIAARMSEYRAIVSARRARTSPKSLIYRSRGPPLTIPRPLAAAATLIRVRACTWHACVLIRADVRAALYIYARVTIFFFLPQPRRRTRSCHSHGTLFISTLYAFTLVYLNEFVSFSIRRV